MQLNRRKRGIALATSLMLMMLLLTLGLSLLTSSQRDLNFQRKQLLGDRAQTLARSGIEYFQYLENERPGDLPAVGSPETYAMGNGEFIVLEAFAAPAGTYTSKGRVVSGNSVTERTVVVPGGAVDESYDANL